MGSPNLREALTNGWGKLLIFVGRRPAAYFPAILIDEPHSFRAYLLERALDPNLLPLGMVSAIKGADTSMSEAAEVADMRLARPEWKPLKNFRLARSPPWPDVFDEAISS
jgi:hypothetical protein